MLGKRNEDNTIWGSYEREKRLEKEKKAEQVEHKQNQRMWAEDRDIHKMTRKKEIIMVVVIVVLVLLFIVISIIGRISRIGSIHRN